MPANLTDSATYTSQIQVPVDTDAFELDGLVLAYQQLANRAAYLKANALINGELMGAPKTINAGAQALTFSGDSGAFAVTRTSGAITLHAGANLNLEADNNVAIDCDNDLLMSATGDATLAASSFTLSVGSSWPALSSRTITDHALTYQVERQVEAEWASGDESIGAPLQQIGTIAPKLYFHLNLPPGVAVNAVSLRVQSQDQPAAGLPSSMPSVTLYSVAPTGVATQLGSTVTDTSANVAAYAAYHDLTVTPPSPHVMPQGGRLLFVLNGASHASQGRLLYVLPPFASIAVTQLRQL
jgi:hypothetical protein